MKKPLVILIHGIRTTASWQSRIAFMLEEKTSAKVIPLKYGYFDIFRFLCPFGLCRKKPIERLRQELEGIVNTYDSHEITVIAHSFGTYAISSLLKNNPYLTFDRLILCGSVVEPDYDWRRVENQITQVDDRISIINEVGLKDIWPVLAGSVTWGYGASGTYGFGAFNVKDRIHSLRHGEFFTNDFVEKNWVPLIKNEKVDFSSDDKIGSSPPSWFKLLHVLPLKYLGIISILLTLMASGLVINYKNIPFIGDFFKTNKIAVGSYCTVNVPPADPLNVRATPLVHGTFITSLDNDQNVYIHELTKTASGAIWARIAHPKLTGSGGWVNSHYLRC